MYDNLRKWLIISPSLGRVKWAIDRQSLGIDSDVVIAVPLNDKKNLFKLYDVYNPDKFKNLKLNITFYGTWHHSHGFDIALTQGRLHRRANLHNLTFTAAYLVT